MSTAPAPATNGQFSVYGRHHAKKINNKYNENKGNNISWIDRWNQTLARYPIEQQNQIRSRLKSALKRFSKKYPGVKSFQDPNFRMCKALTKKLTAILIDTTIQRELDLNWVIKIIEDFRPYQAQPLQIYQPLPEDMPEGFDAETWSCWEGQHTGMALYLIGTVAFGMKPDDIEVPTVEYEFANRVECRTTFMANNSKDGRKVLDSIDIISQKIFAVRLDSADDPEWKEINKKQLALEAQDLFMTHHEKFHDEREPGAITRPGDICDDKYSVELVRQFTVYASAVLAANPRAINAKELPIIMGFLKMADQTDGIDYTDDQIRSLAYLCMNLFEADFDESGFFWEKVGIAYVRWHERYHADMEESMRPGVKLNKDWAQGGTFFYWLLKQHWTDDNGNPMPIPKLNISTSFRPAAKDLSW